MARLAGIAVPTGFLLVALVSLVIVARGRYPVGLDFEGGAQVVFEGPQGGEADAPVPDDCEVVHSSNAVSLECRDFDAGDLDRLVGRWKTAAPAMSVINTSVIAPAFASWAGRRLGLLVCAAACLLAAVPLVSRRHAWLAAAAAAAVVAGMLGWLLARGLTFTLGTYLAGLWLALPTALAVALARGDRPAERLRRSWIGWAALLVALGLAGVASRMKLEPSTWIMLLRGAGFQILRSGPVFAVGALALFHPGRRPR